MAGSGRLDDAARWSRAFKQAYPDNWMALDRHIRSLIALGAWEQARAEIEGLPADTEPETTQPMLWASLFEGSRPALARSHFESAEHVSGRYSGEFFESFPVGPIFPACQPAGW